MRGFLAFTKKEFLEQLRTSKTLILIAVFFLFGMTSPLLAKLMPEILSGMELQGMKIIIPDPTVFDAYGQFFKNCTQMGMLALLLVFGSMLSNELMRGTLINILAKGLPRHTVILSKFLAAAILWTISFCLAALVNYGYTIYLFEVTGINNLLFSHFSLWLFGCFILALVLLSSAITSGNFGGLIVTALGIVIMFMIDIFPNAAKYNPITLASDNMALLSGEQTAGGLIITIIITCGLLIASLIASIVIFQKKRL
jgi:ABC-2 type transport system permease protein